MRVETSKQLDWLSFTLPNNERPSVAFSLLVWTKTGNGRHGYKTRYDDRETGMVCETDADNPEMGSHYTLSGNCLEALRRDMGGTDNGLCGHLIALRAKASRIDLTLNIHAGRITPRSMQRAINNGEAKAKATVSRFIEGKNGLVSGDTFYIGAPTADRQFRCYDKAAELGVVDGAAWIRLELELRRIRANNALQAVASNGVADTVTGHLSDFVHWGNAEYTFALSDGGIPPVDVPRRDSNRRRWLLGQVAQALAKEIWLDDEFANKFWREVLDNFQGLDKG
jgi:Replication initiation factor